ncbi:efflux RND transporter permease subunit, partial [Thiolapillus sp.]
MSQAYFIWILRHRWLVVILSVILIALAASGARFLGFSNDYRMFFSEENPQLLAFEALQNTYTKTDNILFVVSPRDGNVFTPKTLATVEWLTKESWQLPYSLRVDSITNYQHTEAEEDDLLVADLVEDAANLTDEQLKKIRDVALHEPLLRNRLISPDGAHTGINITVQLPGKKLDEVPEVADFAYKLAQRAMEQNPDVEVRVTGLVAMNATFPKMAQNDMQTLYPLMLLIILVTMAFMLRSISGVVVSMLVLLMAVFATLGLTGWLGMQMSPPTTSAPVMVMTLAVADCIHIIVLFLQGLRKGEDKETAMLESLRLNLGPVFLTSITTAIGFLSLNFSDAPPFRDLGNMAAMGVMVALLLSLSFLPALLMILPVKASTRHTRGQGVMERLGDFVIRKCTPLFWGMAALIVLLVSQVPRNHLNDEFIKYFSENVPFRVDTDYAVEHLTGIYLLEYSLPAGGEGMIANPEYLQHVEAFANWLRQQPEVLHVNTITDIMKRLNKNMHGDDPSWYKLPDNQELAAQYLLLYEFSLPFGLDLNNQINVRKSATRLTASLKSISSEQLLTLDQKAAQWLKDNVPAYIQTHGASPSVMFANIGHRNIRAMLKGTTVALVLISLILMFS